jgi:ferredoxin/flavodoxin
LNAPNTKTLALVYVSPQGTARKAGRTIASFLANLGYTITEYDLAGAAREAMRSIAAEAGQHDLLLVGSPVYADHPLRPIYWFLEDIPKVNKTPALTYATFGGVSKGIALYEMGRLLAVRGYSVKGAAQVQSVHSMMFRSRNPLGSNHPCVEDWQLLEEWIDLVAPRLKDGDGSELDIESTRRDSRFYFMLTKTVFNMRVMGMMMPPIRFNSAKCADCGACKKRCPSGRLHSIPGRPDKGIGCLHCFECVRVCPEGAMNAPMFLGSPFIRLLQKISKRHEVQATKYYL